MKQEILDQCKTRGACSLDKTQFDQTFSGRDLTIQVRAALDFAAQNGLAFGRSAGGQQFLFTRCAAVEPEVVTQQRRPKHPKRRTPRRSKPSRR